MSTPVKFFSSVPLGIDAPVKGLGLQFNGIKCITQLCNVTRNIKEYRVWYTEKEVGN